MNRKVISMVCMAMAWMTFGYGTSHAANDLISVITREEGSGTRGAFVEIVGLVEDGVDNTSVDAIVHDGTGKVMTAVQNDTNAMGYISLGSLNDTIKALAIDGILPTASNVKNGTYKVSRPFNITMKKEIKPVVDDFIKFILSTEGQNLADANGFIRAYETNAYTSTKLKGAIVVGGSTSVYPLMEKLAEAYQLVNPNATITIEAIGSSAGIKGSLDGTFDIGMASRELKDAEKAQIAHLKIAIDGIAVIVHKENPLNSMTLKNVKRIYKDEITRFDDV